MPCSFCRKEARDVRALLFEPGRQTICDECLAVCRDIIEDARRLPPVPADREPLKLPRPYEIDEFLARLPERSWMQLRRLVNELRFLSRPGRKPQPPLICSFCGDDDPGKMIAGPTTFICDRCVAQGTELLEQKARLIEFLPPQVASSRPMQGGPAPELSDRQCDLVLDAMGNELRGRHDALSSAMQIAASTAAGEAAVVDDAPELTMNAEMMLSSEERENLDRGMPFRTPVCIVGGSAERRRRLAHRLHQLSRQPGPFLRIDCAAPGSLARMRKAENGTLFLDDVPSLSAAAQELLAITGADVPGVYLRTWIVSTAHDSKALSVRVEQGEFSGDLVLDVHFITLDISGR